MSWAVSSRGEEGHLLGQDELEAPCPGLGALVPLTAGPWSVPPDPLQPAWPSPAMTKLPFHTLCFCSCSSFPKRQPLSSRPTRTGITSTSPTLAVPSASAWGDALPTGLLLAGQPQLHPPSGGLSTAPWLRSSSHFPGWLRIRAE